MDDLKPCPFCGKGAIKGTARKNGKTIKFAGCMNELCSAERWKLPIGQWNNRALESELIEALESVSEELDFVLQKLGVCGQGDGKGHKTDVESFGGTAALEIARNIITKAMGN